MVGKRALCLFAVLAACAVPTVAAPPDACSFVSLEEVNKVAGGQATSREVRNHPKLSECSFLDTGKSAVYTLKPQEDADARCGLAIMRRGTRTPETVAGIGGDAIYHAASRAVYAAKRKLFISSYFTGGAHNTGESIVAFSTTVIARIK